MLAGEITFSHRGERHFAAPQGAQSEAPGARAHSEIRRTGGATEVIPSKVETAAGGGYGDPAERDLRNGKVSAEAAARDDGWRGPLTPPRPPRSIAAPGPGRRGAPRA